MKLRTNMSNSELRLLSKALDSASHAHDEVFVPQSEAEKDLVDHSSVVIDTFLSKMKTLFSQEKTK